MHNPFFPRPLRLLITLPTNNLARLLRGSTTERQEKLDLMASPLEGSL